MSNPRIVVEAAGDFRRLYSDMSKADSRFGKMGSTIKAGLAGAAIAGSAAIVKFGIDSVKASSSAEQSIGATETVFGRYADTVIKRSKQASDAVGLSANEYRELGNVTGAMLQNAGTPLRKVTELTDKLTRRAADLAATYGGTTRDAIESVNALLRGETDPIEKYGVSIQEADIKARLAAKGLEKLEGAALKQAKQQARLELLFEQTSKAAGQFGRESDTIAGKGQRLGAKVEDLEAKFGTLLIPALSAGADVASDKLIPALDDLAGWLAENKDEFAELGGTVKDSVLPPLKAAVDLAQGAVEVFGDLPGPVKDLAVQAGIAALVLPRLSGAVASVTATSGGMLANLRDAEKRTAALSTAAKNAAGIGGLLALTQGVRETNDGLSLLETTAGGALLGFSIGGPWGAAIGAGGGAMLSLATHTEKAATAADRSRTSWESYRDTLDLVTGATTAATKAAIIRDLQETDTLSKVSQLGISQATLVNGILGQKQARDELTAAIETQKDALKAEGEAWAAEAKRTGERDKAKEKELVKRFENIEAIEREIGEVKKATKEERELLLVMQNFPDNVTTLVQTPGAVDSKRELAELSATYALTPKQIATVIKMNGIEASKADVISLSQEIIKSGKVKPDDTWRNFFSTDLGKAKRDAQASTNDLNSLLSAAGNVTPKIRHGAFGQGLSGDLSQLKTLASSGGTGVGTNLGSGMYTGLGQWINPISQRAASMVRGAVSAANAAGAIQSPSRETMRTGDMLGLGLVRGLERSRPAARTAGQLLMAAVLGGVDDGRTGVDNALERITKQIQKTITGKNQGKRESALLKRLADEYKALRLNGNAQDRINDKLEVQRDRLKDLRQEYADYAKSIRDAVVATGELTQLGKQDDGTVSIRSLLNELENKVIGAERFAFLTERLAQDGLSQASVQQLLSAGPEAALATAEAIAAGGAAAISEINQLQARLAASGDTLGDRMADRYYGAGVDAAQGIVKGLEAEAARLDRAAVSLANALVAAVKRALGIRSPSKEFREIANQVTDGLTLQLKANETYVKRTGAGIASSLVKGFDNPQLDARVLAGASSSSAPLTGTFRFSAQQISQFQRGEQLQADLDFARHNGVIGQTF